MELTKSAIKKQMHIEAGEVTEVIDVKMQIRIEEGDSYEDIRMLLQRSWNGDSMNCSEPNWG